MFNIGISSKALFGLSPGPLKLYMMFVLNGRKSEPSIDRFSKCQVLAQELYQDITKN